MKARCLQKNIHAQEHKWAGDMMKDNTRARPCSQKRKRLRLASIAERKLQLDRLVATNLADAVNHCLFCNFRRVDGIVTAVVAGSCGED